MFKSYIYFLLGILLFFFLNCSQMKTQVKQYGSIEKNLVKGNYSNAVNNIDLAKEESQYHSKDRVLFYLDKGILLYYQGAPRQSNLFFERAEKAMEELFTKSISKATLSFMLNDNVLDYFGEIHENLYLNIFKALNYLKLNQIDEAYVEIKRLNNKMRELEDRYRKYAASLNKNENAKGKIEFKSIGFNNDALADFISYLIFSAEGEEDNSRISFEKMNEAWRTQPAVYRWEKQPEIPFLSPPSEGRTVLAPLFIISFTGLSPVKRAEGFTITTEKDQILLTDLSNELYFPPLVYEGIKPGLHFKLALPVMSEVPSQIDQIEIYIDGRRRKNLQLIENIGNLASYLFKSKQKMIYTKTIIRTVVKGLAASQAKTEINKKTAGIPLLGGWINKLVDSAVDATENPDLRSWRTMPQKSFAGQFLISKGRHQIEIRFLDKNGGILKTKFYNDYEITDQLNLINPVALL